MFPKFQHARATKDTMPAPSKHRKVAVVGNRSVGIASHQFINPNIKIFLGKSSISVQLVEGHFVESYYPTIENSFSTIIKHKSQEYSTEIIDTAGQVRRASNSVMEGNLTITVFGYQRMNIAS